MAKHSSFYVVVLISVTVLSLSAHAADHGAPPVTVTQLGELTASDITGGDQFGVTLAASGDTVVANRYIQYPELYVFVKPSTGWTSATESAILMSSNPAFDLFGAGVSNNAVAALNGPGGGRVLVFVRPAGGWSGTITESAVLSGCVGNTIAFSDDVIVVGYAGGNMGCVFVRPAGGWKTRNQPDAMLNIPLFGSQQLTLSVSGDTIVAGLSGNFGSEGTLYLYSKPSTGWSGTLDPTATLISSHPHIGEGLGSAVSVSGNTVAACTSKGKVYIFVSPPTGWKDTTETAIINPPANSLLFAASVALSGKMLVVGAPGTTVGFNQFQGAAFVYQQPNSGWQTTSKYSAEIVASGGAPNDNFGSSLALGGGDIFVGVPNATVELMTNEGAVYVFEK